MVTVGEYLPEAGDLVWLDFIPQAGHEQAGRRPALVLSPRAYNAKTSLAIVCPITNRAKGYPFESGTAIGEKIAGVVLSDHVKEFGLAAARAMKAGKSPAAVLRAVRERLRRCWKLPEQNFNAA